MKKTLFLLILSFSSNCSKAQHEFGLKLDAGISTISTDFGRKSDLFDKTTPLFSGSFGFSYEYVTDKLIGFEADLLITQLNSSYETSQIEPSKGCIACTGTTYTKIKYYLTYVNLPIYVKFSFQKIGIGIGLRTGINLAAIRSLHTIGEIDGAPFEVGPLTKAYSIKKIDFGPAINLEYLLNDRIKIGLNAFASAFEVAHKNYGSSFFNYQFTAGIHYKLEKN